MAAACPRSSGPCVPAPLPDPVPESAVMLALAGSTTPGTTAALPDVPLAGAALAFGATLCPPAALACGGVPEADVGPDAVAPPAAIGCAMPGTTACRPVALAEGSAAFGGAGGAVDDGRDSDRLSAAAPPAPGVAAAVGATVARSTPAAARCPLSTKPTTPSEANDPPYEWALTVRPGSESAPMVSSTPPE